MRLGNPWFVANDACDCLAIGNTSDALADLDDDDKLKLTKDELDTLVSNEGIKCSVDSRVQSQTKSRSIVRHFVLCDYRLTSAESADVAEAP